MTPQQLPLTPAKPIPLAAPPSLHGTRFMGWYDPDRKRSVPQKIAAAAARFAEKFGWPATVCLCSLADAEQAGETDGLIVEASGYVARHTFYLGTERVA